MSGITGTIPPLMTHSNRSARERFHSCCDFPTLSGSAAHFGSLLDDHTYDCVSSLDLHSCLLQGGIFTYEAGGPQGRVLGLTNTIFERSVVILKDKANDGHGAYAETLTAANNLFYDCDMSLAPVSTSGGAGWSFIDNIFDNTVFNGNGPAAVNKYNGYVGSNPPHVSPTTETGVNPNLASLAYQTGPLGRFYLPNNATTLLGQGSRTAGQAGLYHFTSLVSNAKQAGGQVNVGPAYVALVNGGPTDSNAGGPDGIPDFIADRNGDGSEGLDEAPWTTANTEGIAIVSSFGNTPVTGIIQLRVNLGTHAPTIRTITATVGGWRPPESPSVAEPAHSIAQIEIDTRRLANGSHTVSIRGYDASPLASGYGAKLPEALPLTFTTANQVCYPDWEPMDEQNLRAKLSVPPTATARLWFFDAGYAKSYDPGQGSVNQVAVSVGTDGNVDYDQSFASLGYPPGTRQAYLITEVNAGTPDALAAQAPPKAKSPDFPQTGNWAAAYEDDGADFVTADDPANPRPNPPLGKIQDHLDLDAVGGWLHADQLNAWLGSAHQAGAMVKYIYPGQPNSGGVQTWPVRSAADSTPNWSMTTWGYDVNKLIGFLKEDDTRNFYARGHGPESRQSTSKFFNLEDSRWQTGHRYRFVFLDGCLTADGMFLEGFGMRKDEREHGMKLRDLYSSMAGPMGKSAYPYPQSRPGVFLAYWTPTIVSIWDDPDHHLMDPNTGVAAHSYDALCDWHAAFVGFWEIDGYDLITSAKKASDTTMCAAPISPLPRRDPTAIVPTDYDELGDPDPLSSILFTPDDCLMVYGYGNLKFRTLNHTSDTWLPDDPLW